MAPPATAELIADFLLRYYREPLRYRAEAPRAAHRYGNLEPVLRLALGRRIEFDDSILRGASGELERAAVFYIQQQFFRDDATHYDVLGLAADATGDAVREHFRLLMQLIHPDRQGRSTIWAEGHAARANRAYAVLKSPRGRGDYDRDLAAARASEAAPRPNRPGADRAGARRPAAAPAAVTRRAFATRRRPVPRPVLPEWLSSGVGGFVREHPGPTAFAVLIVVSSLAVLSVVGVEHDAASGLDSREYRPRPSNGGVADAPPKTSPPLAADELARTAVQDTQRVALNGAPAPESVPPVAAASTSASARGADAKRVVDRSPIVMAGKPSAAAVAATPAPVAAVEMTPDVRRTFSNTDKPGPQRATEAATAPAQVASPAYEPARPGKASAARVAPAPAAPMVAQVAPAPHPPRARSGEGTVVADARAAYNASSLVATTPSASASARESAPPTPEAPMPPVSGTAREVAAAPAAGPVIAMAAASPGPALAATPAGMSPATRNAAVLVAPPRSTEVEALVAAFVAAYERGRLESLTRLFGDDAQAERQRGKAAIAGAYDEIFQLTSSRRMAITRLSWKAVGDRIEATGEGVVQTVWRDGREIEQHVAIDMDFVRQDGRAVISKLSLRPQ